MIIRIDHELYRFANEGFDQADYLGKINKYKNECGCSLGAIFTTLAIIIFGVYAALTVDWTHPDFVKVGLSGLFSILFSAAIGKIIGIGIARIRLKLLYEFLIQKKYLELIETR